MKRTTFVLLTVLFLQTICFSQALTWYRFDNTFISNSYSNSAIGNLSFNNFHPAGNVHSTSCGGNDGELHIGMRLPEVALPAAQMPLTNAPSGTDPNWGLVAELPNASQGNGPSKLAQLSGQPITFQGYFRVWDEGHGSGASPPSNPHHVFEMHPAWGFKGGIVTFMQKNLVASMASYQGYGATKFKPMFQEFTNQVWPLAYQDGQTLFVGLKKNANFYQLPVRVTGITSVTGGHEVKVEVFSNQAMTASVFPSLTVITVSGSPIDTQLHAGQKTFLLGFFSVNLKKALDASAGAHTPQTAISVGNALEFFAFGIAVNGAVSSCSSN